jgi:hypothetical protein
VRRRLACLLLVGAAACSGSDPPPAERPTCEVRFEAPSGFEPLSTFEEEYADHVGVRLGFLDEQRRELHVLVGIPGEIGEGLPSAGEVELTEGRSGALLGRETVWVVRWDEADVCDPRAIIGNGFDRPSFLDALAEAGVAPTGSSR